MKYFVMSDLHGSSYYTKKVLDVYRAGEYEKILLLGDVLYHGPRNDLPKDYAPKEVIAMTRKWIKWYWNFLLWQTMHFSTWEAEAFS